VLKENIHKLTTVANHIEDQEQKYQNVNKVKTINFINNSEQYFKRFTEISSDFDSDETNLGTFIYFKKINQLKHCKYQSRY